jgi:23S rRNA (guanosine2251-2'-O)-methyltransferase
MIKIRNKHAMLELLREKVSFEKITLVQNLDQDNLTKDILAEAKKCSVLIEELPIRKMSQSRSGEAREVIVGYLAQQKTWRLDQLLAEFESKKQTPFFLLMNKVNLANNIGAITRTAFAAGVNGIIFEGSKDEFFNEDTVHYSLGAIARIPHVKMILKDAVRELKTHNIATVAIDMKGTSYFKENLSGPVAFVLGAEREGLPSNVLNNCDKKVSIPMRPGIDSLNVAASAAIVLYEKVRQESINT